MMLLTQEVADDIKGETFADAHQVLRCAAEGPGPVCYHLQGIGWTKFSGINWGFVGTFAKPKSVILRWPSRSRSRFSGFKSLDMKYMTTNIQNKTLWICLLYLHMCDRWKHGINIVISNVDIWFSDMIWTCKRRRESEDSRELRQFQPSRKRWSSSWTGPHWFKFKIIWFKQFGWSFFFKLATFSGRRIARRH